METKLLRYSSGIIKYSEDQKQAIVLIDQGIADFYFSIIPKYLGAKKQKHPAHITIVRRDKELPTKTEYWGKYENKSIEFIYDYQIYDDGTYFFLEVQSEEIGRIREELGLPRFRFNNCYHITIGNRKRN